jgi:hypothetical protein
MSSVERAVTASPPHAAQLTPHDYVPAKRRLGLRDIWASWRITRMVAARDIRVKYKQASACSPRSRSPSPG